MKNVTKQELFYFVENYDKKIVSHTVNICDPPIINFYEEEKRVVIARIVLNREGYNEYKIKQEE